MEVDGSITAFLAEFSAFGLALRSLSGNNGFADRAEQLLDLNARIRLLKRMAFVRNLDFDSCQEINQIEERAARLIEKRDELLAASRYEARFPMTGASLTANSLAVGSLRRERESLNASSWTPTAEEIDDCRKETQHMRRSLADIAERAGAEQQSQQSRVD